MWPRKAEDHEWSHLEIPDVIATTSKDTEVEPPKASECVSNPCAPDSRFAPIGHKVGPNVCLISLLLHFPFGI